MWGWANTWVDGEMDRQTDRQIGGWVARSMDE